MKKNLQKIKINLFRAFLFSGLFLISGFKFSFGDSKLDNSNLANTISFTNPIAANNLQEFLRQVLGFLAEIGSIFVVLALIYAGFLLVTARGNEQQLSKGKLALMWAIIGGAIVLGAWALSVGVAETVGKIIGT